MGCLAGKEMMALAFTTVPSNWRRVGHILQIRYTNAYWRKRLF